MISSALGTGKARMSRAGLAALAGMLTCGLLVGCQTLGGDDRASSGPVVVHDKQYISLRDRLKTGDLSIDFTELRFAYTLTSQYDGSGATLFKQFGRIGQAARERESGDWLLTQVKTQLDRHYPDLGWHVMMASLYSVLRQPFQAVFHREVMAGLMQSIEESGDGRSLDTAYTVISVQEMQWYLRLNGIDPYETEMVKRDGHSYARVRFSLPGTAYGTGLIYFDIDTPAPDIERLQRALRDVRTQRRESALSGLHM